MKCTSRDRDIGFIEEREQEINAILEENEPIEKKQLDINGNDIVNLGYKQGKIIGEILDYLLEIVLEDSKLNKKETLIKMLLDKFKM